MYETSKALRRSTEDYNVWLTLARNYSARHFYHPRPATGTLSDLKTKELRAWTQKRLIVDELWKMRRVRPSFYRSVDEEFSILKLVPGGRWVLVGYIYGSVCYYDLDSQRLEQSRSFIEPPSDIGGHYQDVDALDIYVDQEAPVFQFKVVVSGIGESNDSRSHHLCL